MSRQLTAVTEQLQDYIQSVSLREPDILRQLRDETAGHQLARMQIGPEQGQFMALLVKTLDARNILEIGVFTGYSSLVMALAMADDGRLVACDISEDYTATARRYWEQAGVGHKIELRIAPALTTMDDLLSAGSAGSFDFVFLDGDKLEYRDYYERALELLRTGGVIAVDNVLWNGAVADPGVNDDDTVAIRAFNDFVGADERIDLSLVPIGDGLTLCRKR